MIELTDLSKYNRKVNYARMQTAGVCGAWIKVCQGLDASLDPLYAVHTQGCDELDLPNGPYFFADYRKDAHPQAGRLVELLGEGGAAALDLEYLEGWGKPAGEAMHAWACGFAEEFIGQTHGAKTLALYCNVALIHAMRPCLSASPLLKLPLWLAHWTSAKYIDCEPWERWTFWQQAGDVPASWSEGKVDRDWFDGSAIELRAFFDGFPAPATLTLESLDERVHRLEERMKV